MCRLCVILLCLSMLLEFGSMGPESASYQYQPALNILPAASSENDAPFNYVVVIVMENQGFCDIVPSALLDCGTRIYSAPYMTSLTNSSGLTENYTAIAHPSLPNYLALVSGQDFSSWSVNDCSPGPGCTAGSAPNLVDSLESRGLTWKAYMEDLPSNCYTGNLGHYTSRHNPFAYFDDIVKNPARCDRIVSAG